MKIIMFLWHFSNNGGQILRKLRFKLPFGVFLYSNWGVLGADKNTQRKRFVGVMHPIADK